MKRQLYAGWIAEVRGKMSQEEFGARIYHYTNEKEQKGKVCVPYRRNQVGNWERGVSFPESIETILSIALFEFDKNYKRDEKDIDLFYRNRRYQYASEKLFEIFERYLYARNLHDMLLIQVCRNVISFEEVLELEAELEKLLEEMSMKVDDRRKYAMEQQTQLIQDDLLRIQKKEEIRKVVQKSAAFFYTGRRTLGERLKKCFEEEQRYVRPISFIDAVRIFAPNYRDSIQRIFKNDGITREWILDLCVHLRFNRAEIQYILENAHFRCLSDDFRHVESLYRENRYPIGSASWYRYMEKHYPKEFKGHFSDFCSKTLLEKIIIVLLLCSYIEDIEDVQAEIVPVDYMLESFLFYKSGKKAIDDVKKILKNFSFEGEEDIEQIHEQLKIKTVKWILYIQSGFCDGEKAGTAEVYESYKQEFSEYVSFSEKAVKNLTNYSEAVKLRYLAAMMYTVFTGRYYTGDISKADLKCIEAQLENQTDGWRQIYYFINQYLVTFLNNQVLYENKNYQYYAFDGKKKMNAMDMEEIRENLWEIVWMLLVCTK